MSETPCLFRKEGYSWKVLTDRYWIYKEQYLRGPYRPSELAILPDFSDRLLVCQDGDDRWQPVIQLPAFRPYLRIISTGDYQPPHA